MRTESFRLRLRRLAVIVLAVLAPATASPQPVLEVLKSTLSTRVGADQFSGAVLVARQGEVLFEEAYGYADRTFKAPNRTDTKFNLASMGKMFTGVAVLQLAQAGKLSLDATVRAAFPDYPNREVAGKISVRQLLTHTSGLGDFFGPEFFARNPATLDTLESLLPLFADKPLRFAPGSSWAYSNAGYIVLGLIVQRVSGQSYDDYIRDHIFLPAGMRDTGNWPPDADVSNRATGYTAVDAKNAGPRKSNIFFLQRGGSAGGGYSTLGDLLRFSAALQGGRLLNAAYTAEAMKGQVATNRPNVRYGCGFEETTINGVRIVGHSGGGPGIQDIVDLYPDVGYTVIILGNCDDAMAPVNARIRGVLTGRRDPTAVNVPSPSLALLAGHYVPVLPPEMRGMNPPPIVVEPSGKGLSVDPGMGPVHHFLPSGPLDFFDADNPNLTLRFEQEPGKPAGTVTTPTGFGPVPPITATRVQ